MNILVCGDEIGDTYFHCKATRLCPEAPCPVLVLDHGSVNPGGAALVAANLKSLGGNEIFECYGSKSTKYRIFADRTLLCRVDRDSTKVLSSRDYWDKLAPLAQRADILVVADYGKGAMAQPICEKLRDLRKPMFVDSKLDAEKYEGCFAIFPNEHEHPDLKTLFFEHVIRKLGSRGCEVDGISIGTEPQQVYDVTGAGDVFLAAFVWDWARSRNLIRAAHFANQVSGLSVQKLGTYVVKPADLVGLRSRGASSCGSGEGEAVPLERSAVY